MYNNSKAFILFKILINPNASSLLTIWNSLSSFGLLELELLLLFSPKFVSLKFLIADNIFSRPPFSIKILLIFSIILWNQLINICKIWNIWLPNIYKPVTIHANEVEDDYHSDNKKLISAFSGGLDAAYTAYKYKNKLAGRIDFDLDKCVMIQGADIPLKNESQFKIAYSSAKKMTDNLGITLIPVKTNYREIFDCNWEHCFGTFMVAMLNFWSKKYSVGTASDSSIDTYKLPWGMNPITDRYLSNKTFEFIADGYEHNRTQRASFIKEWQIGIDNLRVCWKNVDKSKNCGFCEKCIRTKLNMFVNGVKYMKSMPTQFSFAELNKLPNLDDFHLKFYEESLDFAQKNKTLPDEDIKRLETFISRQKKKSLINNRIKNQKLFLQKIFSVKNEKVHNKKLKVITILGIKIKFKKSQPKK